MKAYLEPKEIEQIEQAAEYLRDKLLIRLLFRLGCRISEVLGLNVSGLERWLQNRGWRTKYISPPDKIARGQEPTHLPVLHVFKANNPKGVEIGWDTMVVAAMEFWMPESIERIIEAIIDQGMPKSAYTVNFPNIGKCAWD